MSFLTQQIGPLPGGAWLGVVGGGLAIGFLGRKKRTAAGPSMAPVPADTAQTQSSQGAVQYAGIGTGVTSMGTPKPATNEEWAQSALSYLIGRGATASRATNAISHILYPDTANPTSPEDSAIYNMAVAGVGAPPSLPAQAFIPDPPAVPFGVVPAPATPTTPAAVPAPSGTYERSYLSGGAGVWDPVALKFITSREAWNRSQLNPAGQAAYETSVYAGGAGVWDPFALKFITARDAWQRSRPPAATV